MACKNQEIAVLVAIISIGLWFCLPNTLYFFENFTYPANWLIKTENLHNSTMSFLHSLIPGMRVTRCIWYSNILSVLFWCHLASFGIRFINIQRTAGRKCCTWCCTCRRLCARCAMTGAALLTMLVLHSCYGSTFLGLWWILHFLTMVALCTAVLMIGVKMPMTPALVDNHLSFVILMCVLFANYEDWRRLDGATCVICPPTIGWYGANATQKESGSNFELQLEKLRVSLPEAAQSSVPSSAHWLVPCAELQPLDTSSAIVTSSTETREQLLAWDQRIKKVAMDFDQYIADGVQLSHGKILDDNTVFKAHQNGNRYYSAPNGTRITFSADTSSIALDVAGNVVRISSTGRISSNRADGTHMQLSTARDSMLVTQADGTEVEVNFRGSTESPTVVAPNYKHAHWFLGNGVAAYKIAGDGRSATCIALCKLQAAPTNETELGSTEHQAGMPEKELSPKAVKSPEVSAGMGAEGVPATDFVDTSEPRDAPKASSEASAQPANNQNNNYCGAWLSDGEKCFLYDRRSINVSEVVPVCWRPGTDGDDPVSDVLNSLNVAPPAPFLRWGAVAANLGGETSPKNDTSAPAIVPKIKHVDAVVALAEEHHAHPAWEWVYWILIILFWAAKVIMTLTFSVLSCLTRNGYCCRPNSHWIAATTFAFVAIEIFVLCDARPGWRLGYIMRMFATCFVIVAGSGARGKCDMILPMLVVIAVYWETSYLRWVTTEVKWWADGSGKAWLFFSAALQLNQGLLMQRVCTEVISQGGSICRCDSRRVTLQIAIGSAVGAAVLSFLVFVIHFTYEWSVVDGQLHRGYCWTYYFFTIILIGLLSFGTLAFVDDPWSGMQKSFLIFQSYCLCAGGFLIWRHWTGGPEYDPSPLVIGTPDLQPLWEALSFRNPTLRWLYAQVFLGVYLSSALFLGNSIVRYASTKGLTVFGVLADCVVPMQTSYGSAMLAYAAASDRRDELRHRGLLVVLCTGAFWVIASLTKHGVDSYLVIVCDCLTYFCGVVAPLAVSNMVNLSGWRITSRWQKYNIWHSLIITGNLWWLDIHSNFYPTIDFLPKSFGFVLWLPVRAATAMLGVLWLPVRAVNAILGAMWWSSNTLDAEPASEEAVHNLDTGDASLLYPSEDQGWLALGLYFGLWVLMVGTQCFAILTCIKTTCRCQAKCGPEKELFLHFVSVLGFMLLLSITATGVMELVYVCAVLLIIIVCLITIAGLPTSANEWLTLLLVGLALLYQHLNPAVDFSSPGYGTPAPTRDEVPEDIVEESVSAPIIYGTNQIISQWILVFVSTVCYCRIGSRERGSCAYKHAAFLVPVVLHIISIRYRPYLATWDPFSSALAVMGFCLVVALCLVWPFPATLWDQRASMALRSSSVFLLTYLITRIPDIPLLVWAASTALSLAVIWRYYRYLVASTKVNARAFAATSSVLHVVGKPGAAPPKLSHNGDLRHVTGLYELIPEGESGGHWPAYWCRESVLLLYLRGSKWAVAGSKDVGGSLWRHPSTLACTEESWLCDPTAGGVHWEKQQGEALTLSVRTSLQIVQESTKLSQAPATALLQKHNGDVDATCEFFHERQAVLDGLGGVSEEEATQLLKVYHNSGKAILAHQDLVALQSLGVSADDAHKLLASNRRRFWQIFLDARLPGKKSVGDGGRGESKSESKRDGVANARSIAPAKPLLMRQQSAKTAFLSWVGIAESLGKKEAGRIRQQLMDSGFDTVSSFADAPDELLTNLGLSSIHRRLFQFGQKTIQEWDTTAPDSELFEFLSKDATAECCVCYEHCPVRRLQRFQCCGTLVCVDCLREQVRLDVISLEAVKCPGCAEPIGSNCIDRLQKMQLQTQDESLTETNSLQCLLCGADDVACRVRIVCSDGHCFCHGCLLAYFVSWSKQRGLVFDATDPRLARPMCPLWTCCNDDFFDLPELLASVCASENDFALLDKLHKNVPSVRLRRPCGRCESGAVNITSKLLKARAETPELPKSYEAECLKCGHRVCASCERDAHRGVDCETAVVALKMWRTFQLRNPKLFSEELLRKVRDEKRTEDMMGARFKQCPHCGYGPIERELGCASMTCGKHAQDKIRAARAQGRNVDMVGERGACGKQFNWSRAPKYEPKHGSLDAAAAAAKGSLSLVRQEGAHEKGTKCSMCHGAPTGTFFECITCDQKTNAADAYWACRRCTLHNKASLQRCSACQAQRRRDVTIMHRGRKARVCWPSCLPRALADENLHKGHVFRLLHPGGAYADEMLRFAVGTDVRSLERRPIDRALGAGRKGRVIFQSVSLLKRNTPLLVVKDLSTDQILVCEQDCISRVDPL